MYTPSRRMLSFYIRGFQYWDGALVLKKLKPGKKLALVAEPDNPYDPNAVRIERRGTKLGYVPRKSNEAVARLLAFGHGDALECRVLSVDRGASPWEQVRVAIDVTDAR